MENVIDPRQEEIDKARQEELESFIEMSVSEFSKMTGPDKAKALTGIINGVTNVLKDVAENAGMAFRESERHLDEFGTAVHELAPIIKREQ